MSHIPYGEGSAYEVAEGKSHRHIYHTAFLMQVFREFDGNNVNQLAYNYHLTERSMGRILKTVYLYIMSHDDVYSSLTDEEMEKLNIMERFDRHGTGSPEPELMVRRFLKSIDLKGAEVRIVDKTNTAEIHISAKKR